MGAALRKDKREATLSMKRVRLADGDDDADDLPEAEAILKAICACSACSY